MTRIVCPSAAEALSVLLDTEGHQSVWCSKGDSGMPVVLSMATGADVDRLAPTHLWDRYAHIS